MKPVSIAGISYDSRTVEPGDIFVSIEGQKVDGNEFIAEAIKRGAAAVVSQKQSGPYDVPLLVVSDVRAAMAVLAEAFFDYPSHKLRLLGVTGTNGKTTTTHLIEHILGEGGHKAGLIGTLGARIPGDKDQGTKSQYIDVKHTTPQASDLQGLLATMVNRGVTHAAMEVSSHALALKRVFGTRFASACLTNISQDHLDFHNTMEHYWQSKRILFEMLAEGEGKRTAVINLDDELAPKFIAAVPKTSDLELFTYSFDNPKAHFHVLESQFDFSGTKLKLATPGGVIDFSTRLSGKFNIYNVMAAMAVCMGEGLSKETVAQALNDFAGVSGRFEVVPASSGQVMAPLCIVDYAHTPDGLDNVLKTARALVPVGGKLVAVFGCGGDRDSTKRPQMGRIAEDLADKVVITSDNPRTELPDQIIADILTGIRNLKKVTVEADRARAIQQTVMAASPQDVVVVAGKGHETYQILGTKTIDFDDRLEVAKALNERTGALKTI
ncbi:MAG: UDP-N-acetylmuramoyl-L-alanyl-D-glutamate--2,6-diaminopimelate ligase [Cyanobacteria bacterium SZAS LIN-2]|nr:UDP-N-acetylmuramoyl-L-alanyl-D-glutamate--2,6-diaminopimelate ligase [Cyanobacteria bacterium SZAS LIN-3]MBS1995555.1 UDP-N-acetylmuramoyl-L-alanyl-D-glutamate--2,6-diaminopimelate ligase [Cyanobacteria bacterium SZAS LIN-2]MBS2009548.1 UDP-N-acetylmuramoyl-L-alanyl-D-glutamate--2,6-diaminopimelate ligase [Cyanobacteria bacterium SZAS TMP-1]